MRTSGRVLAGVLAVAAAAALSACSQNDRDPQLVHFNSSGTPDEFGVLPSRALRFPEAVGELPQPTRGANRADARPKRDAVAALGGRAAGARDGSTPAADKDLIDHSRRFGVEPEIRSRLAAEDLAFRRDNEGRPMERWFNISVYARAYAVFALDGHAELERLRALNIRTPSAPPLPPDR